MDTPRPSPPLSRRVEKNGSLIRSSTSGDIPTPSSATHTSTSPVSGTRRVLTRIPRVLEGRAWRALVRRLMTTCSSCCAEPVTGGRSSPYATSKRCVARRISWLRMVIAMRTTSLTRTGVWWLGVSCRAKSFRFHTIALIRAEASEIPAASFGTTSRISE